MNEDLRSAFSQVGNETKNRQDRIQFATKMQKATVTETWKILAPGTIFLLNKESDPE
jgi:hypothetical protein